MVDNLSPNNQTNKDSIQPPPRNTRREYIKEDRIINHLYQLHGAERDKVKLLFREAQLRGWRLDQIPEYIYIKSKVNVTYKFCKSMKEIEYWDTRQWFYELARDSIAYMGCYRKALDMLDQLEKELWIIIMNSKVEVSARVMAVREMHSITKTSILLLRDLPFITNLSKMYDVSDLDPEARKAFTKLKEAKRHDDNNRYDDDRQVFLKDKTSFNDINNTLVNNILDKSKNNTIVKNILSEGGKKPVDADVMSDMQRQIQELGYDTDPDIIESKEKKRKEIEDKYIQYNMKKMDEELANVSSEDEAKVLKVKQNFKKSMDYLDQIITPEHREAISRIRELTENDEN